MVGLESASMNLDVPITHSARRYGWVFWREEVDEQILEWIGDRVRVPIVFEGDMIGERRVDRLRRRFFIGIPRTSAIAAGRTAFRISYYPIKKGLAVRCV
jgi:hypothetical protein